MYCHNYFKIKYKSKKFKNKTIQKELFILLFFHIYYNQLWKHNQTMFAVIAKTINSKYFKNIA